MQTNQTNLDEFYMAKALSLAAEARGRTSPNPMVGAVIVKNGEIIGQGYHRKAGTAHAEVVALQAAGAAARGATVYVNLEPCSHYGRTPPCAQSLINAGISRVVAAMVDPNPLVGGRGLAMLQAAGIKTATGVMEAEARRLNEIFIKYIMTKQPFVALKWAMTLDGKIATAAGDSRWVTNEASREFVHRLRDQYDAILVGIGTVLADNPRLTTRLPEGGGKDPIRVIVDETAQIPLDAVVLQQKSTARTIIATTALAPAGKLAVLRNCGADVIIVPEQEGKVDLAALMLELGQREITSVLIEGGGMINAAALTAGIIDKVYAFVAPKISGGKDAPGPVSGTGCMRMADALHIKDISILRFADDLLIEGYLSSR